MHQSTRFFEEYVGILHALRSMKDDQAVGGAIAVGLLKKMDSVKFLSVLYMLKYMLPYLSVLSKIFQTGSLNFPDGRTDGRTDRPTDKTVTRKDLYVS